MITFFKMLYDGSSKQYPQGSMMLFILLTEGAHAAPEYRAKILFNHDKFYGLLQHYTLPSPSRKAQRTTENMNCEPVDRLSPPAHSMTGATGATGATKQNESH
jgi:hypothetical protein